jgi:hypothetical protein
MSVDLMSVDKALETITKTMTGDKELEAKGKAQQVTSLSDPHPHVSAPLQYVPLSFVDETRSSAVGHNMA